MTRAVSTLEVSSIAVWEELRAVVELAPHVDAVLSPTKFVMKPSFEAEVLPTIRDRVLVRYARHSATLEERETLSDEVEALPMRIRNVLRAAQRHALEHVVRGVQAWDPIEDAGAVRALHGANLIVALPDADLPPYHGRYRLHPDLPPPPDVVLDFEEAVMPPTDDLEESRPGPVALLHDMASLAAAIDQVTPKRTLTGPLTRADGKRLAKRLGTPVKGPFSADPRWGPALRALEVLRVISTDPIERVIHIDLGLEETLAGGASEAVDRLVHRLLDRDLHAILPALRASLRAADGQAIDEVVFLDLLRDQNRQILFPSWFRDGEHVYPVVASEHARPFDDEGWDGVEAPMVRTALRRCELLGLIRRAPGVFAGTPDGERWAGRDAPTPPVWISGDLEIIVPPDAVTPWERFQLERLGRCLSRDVVDRYRLERHSLVRWLATHDLAEALALLRRRCASVPHSVEETLRTWTQSATRIIITRGVLI